jgi:hypothetical protein
MKRVLTAIGLCLLAALAFLLFHDVKKIEAPGGSDAVSPASRSYPPLAGKSNAAASNHAAAESHDLSARAGQYVSPAVPTNVSPEIVAQAIRRAIHNYGEMFGGDPVGTNPEITAALTGRNPKGINFLSGQPGIQIDADGALIDSWNTPYFFHQLSATQTEVRSAGPDRLMWTSDDIVAE